MKNELEIRIYLRRIRFSENLKRYKAAYCCEDTNNNAKGKERERERSNEIND